MLFDNKRKELEGTIQTLIKEKESREALEREERERQMVVDFVTAVGAVGTQITGLNKAIAELKEPIQTVTQVLRDLTAMQDGITAMIKQSADQLDQFTKAVEILERSMSPTDTNYSEYAEEGPEGKERQQRAEVREMMRRGIPPEQAQARLRERDIYSELGRQR